MTVISLNDAMDYEFVSLRVTSFTQANLLNLSRCPEIAVFVLVVCIIFAG